MKNTFESFVVGANSAFAFTAAKAIAENPGIVYNPLMIYGRSGLGKTHLLDAIGHAVLKMGIFTTPSSAGCGTAHRALNIVGSQN